MGTKNNPGANDCYAAALDDEPMFTLLARDISAPSIVSAWADRRLAMIRNNEAPDSDVEKVKEALICAHEMREWRRHNLGLWRHTPLFPEIDASDADGPCQCFTCKTERARRCAEPSPPTPAEGWAEDDGKEIEATP